MRSLVNASRLRISLSFTTLSLALAFGGAAAQDGPFYPAPFPAEWERRAPEEVGLDPAALQAAVDWAADTTRLGWEPDLENALRIFLAGEPENEIVGPMKPHGGLTGVILRQGYLVAEWGNPDRVDMTFSVTKSFTSTVAGLAWDRGLIGDLHDPVRKYVPHGYFDSDHNRVITWDMLLRQTSEWEGELWGKPHWVDRFDGERRPLQRPGTVYDYNDVRVNLLALSLLNVWRRPLPEVLREHVMDPIGASNTWRWNGYENSWVVIDGQRMQSVSGGGHWGGGMWISAYDQARFGLLSLRRGMWEGERVLSEEWIDMATTPGELSPNYGFMNWVVNAGRRSVPSAPESSFYHAGAGANRIWVDPEHDIVAVVRWLGGQHFDGFIERLLAAVVDDSASDR